MIPQLLSFGLYHNGRESFSHRIIYKDVCDSPVSIKKNIRFKPSDCKMIQTALSAEAGVCFSDLFLKFEMKFYLVENLNLNTSLFKVYLDVFTCVNLK